MKLRLEDIQQIVLNIQKLSQNDNKLRSLNLRKIINSIINKVLKNILISHLFQAKKKKKKKKNKNLLYLIFCVFLFIFYHN